MKQTFEEWMKQIDRIIGEVCGLGHGDIGDQCYYDWYDDGVTPMQAAKRALKNEGFPMNEFPKLVKQNA
jgi:Family of unknown function (DUF5419)